MPIPVYLARPEDDISAVNEYLQAAKTKFPWINFEIQKWPCEGKFKSGITGTIYSDVADNLAKWASESLKLPAIVIANHAICFPESFLIAGLTHHQTPSTPLCIIPTVFLDGTKIPVDVIGKSVVHELLHVARNMKGRLADTDKYGHCRNPPCVLTHAGGNSESELVDRILNRTDQPCAKCSAVLAEIERDGEWS